MTILNRLELPKEVWREFVKDDGMILSAAVSFYEFLSLFPLLLVSVGVLGYVLKSPERAERILTHSLGHFLIGSQASAIVREIVHGSNAAAGIGIVLLLWSGMSAVVVLEQAINKAWNAGQQRGFLKRRVIAIVTLICAGVLVLASLGLTALIRVLRTSSPEALSDLALVWRLVGYVVPAMLSIGLFVLLYKLLPNTRVSWRTALVAGVFSGVLWEIAKQAFTFYALNFAHFSRVYGSLASVILLMVWIYYSSIITILGAELGAVWQNRHER